MSTSHMGKFELCCQNQVSLNDLTNADNQLNNSDTI